MNACSFCRHAKRKCDRARPSCSNCVRSLRRECFYREDTIETHFETVRDTTEPPRWVQSAEYARFYNVGLGNDGVLQNSMLALATNIIGSFDEMAAVAATFFSGTHQRIAVLSKKRYFESLYTPELYSRIDFLTLCLSIRLIQQMPRGHKSSMRSPLYRLVKHFLEMLEGSGNLSIDLAQSRVLATFYEIGHGLHTAAYISVAMCARVARALGAHRVVRRDTDPIATAFITEEKCRIWWAITVMDRFVSLCNGDDLVVTQDAKRKDPLPIEDLIWSEGTNLSDLQNLVHHPPTLDTPLSVTVGQLARECQIAHLAGRVIQHLFSPMPDEEFQAREAVQLERTLQSYLPLLANEELKIGKYCGAFGICNSALLMLYELMLSRSGVDDAEKARIMDEIKDTSFRAIAFAEAAYSDRAVNYPADVQSPYLIYSLYQAAVIQYGYWKQTADAVYHNQFTLTKSIITEFTHRWQMAWQYLERLDHIDESLPAISFPFQGVFISTGEPHITPLNSF